MAKKPILPKPSKAPHTVVPALNLNQGPDATPPTRNGSGDRSQELARLLTRNWSTFQPGDLPYLIRQNILDSLIDPRHNIDKECGYPSEITPIMYHLMYERNGIARKVVHLWPNACWALDPLVYEDESEDVETEFESAWNELAQSANIWWHLKRMDILSGIARYGVLLLGLDDGRPYSEPVEGLDTRGLVRNKAKPPKHRLLFVRAFDETAVQVSAKETDPRSPRFGMPTKYQVTFRELDITEPMTAGNIPGTTMPGGMVNADIHWTRILHVADNREMSEIYGTPRMKPHWNLLCDIRKTIGGSAEMFWKGAFPGISFELAPGVSIAEGDIDQEALKDAIERYTNGLDRYLAVAGLTAKTLAPQMADPKSHIDTQLELLSIGLDVPVRVFRGSERGELSSSQDAKEWNKRVDERRQKYVGPMIIRAFIERLIALGVLPRCRKKPYDFTIWWPDLTAISDQEKAQLVSTKTQACATYISGGVDALIPPYEYLTMLHDMPPEQAKSILAAQREYIGLGVREGEGPGNQGMLLSGIVDQGQGRPAATPDGPANTTEAEERATRNPETEEA